MEIAIWLAQSAIAIIAWFLFFQTWHRLTEQWHPHFRWGESFLKDSFLAGISAALHGLPEEHMEKTFSTVRQSERTQMLSLALRSVSLALPFAILFFVWNLFPTAVLWLLALAIFVMSRWWKYWAPWAMLIFSLALFYFGFERSLQAASSWTANDAQPDWVYLLATNYFWGAVLGFALGGLIRTLTRVTGMAWWIGGSLLLAGVLSLGAAWGFFLGDWVAGCLEEAWRFARANGGSSRKIEFRWCSWIGAGLGLFFLLVTAFYENVILLWTEGQYSTGLRWVQWGLMIFGFLLIQTVVQMVFFHFYFHGFSRRSAAKLSGSHQP